MKKCFFYLMLACLPTLSFAQQVTNTLEGLIQNLDIYRNRYPQEKIHLQFDRPHYGVGDTIWFKAYVVIAEKNQLSYLNKFIYIDLISPDDSIKQTLTLPLRGGVSWGNLITTSNLKGGNYRIRAYTNWMTKFGESFFFNKQVPIVDASAGTVKVQNNNISEAAKIDIQFFPEGGHLVAGLMSKIGIKSVGNDGLSREVTGTIVDQDNKKVAEFKTEHAGIGSFDFTPSKLTQYVAVLKLGDGSEKKISLPSVQETGYVLSAIQDGQSISIRVSSSNEQEQPLTLAVQANGVLQYAAKTKPGEKIFTVTLPSDRFSEGINQVTLFSAAFLPVAERLVFIQHPENHLSLVIKPGEQQLRTRAKTSLSLLASDESQSPVRGNFSVSVTNDAGAPYDENAETTIFSNLLLTSDLKGNLEQPNYYFIDVNDDKRRQLDNLMLTQGWRRFTWPDLLAGKFPAAQLKEEEDGFQISGRVLDSKRNVIPGAKISLIPLSKTGFLMDTLTDQKGRFSFSNIAIYDSVKYSVQVFSKKKELSDAIVEFDKQAKLLVPVAPLPFKLPAESQILETYTKMSMARGNSSMGRAGRPGAIALKEVSITEKRRTDIQKTLQNSANLNGPGSADQILTYKDFQNYHGNIGDAMQGKLLGIRLVDKYGKIYAYSNRNINAKKVPSMAIVYDGVMASEMSLDNIPTVNVASVEILQPGARTAVYGPPGASGVIVITSKRGGVDYDASLPGSQTAKKSMITYDMVGYTSQREFYSPVYTTRETIGKTPNLRPTIYWNPTIYTGEDGTARLEYFNSDQKGTYKIIVEGLTSDGKLGRSVVSYNVQ